MEFRYRQGEIDIRQVPDDSGVHDRVDKVLCYYLLSGKPVPSVLIKCGGVNNG